MATSERLSVRLPAETMAVLKSTAAAETRTVAQVARMVLGKWADERQAREIIDGTHPIEDAVAF
jgi:hypothetical protein